MANSKSHVEYCHHIANCQTIWKIGGHNSLKKSTPRSTREMTCISESNYMTLLSDSVNFINEQIRCVQIKYKKKSLNFIYEWRFIKNLIFL